LNKLHHSLAQNVNTMQKNIPQPSMNIDLNTSMLKG